jgi:hypothetical protein
MDRHGVAHAAVAQDLDAPRTSFFPVGDDIEREDRRELLDRQRVIAADPVQLGNEHAGIGGDGDAGGLRDRGRRASHELGVRQPLRAEQGSADSLDLGVRHEVPALLHELAPDLVDDRCIDDH